MISALALGDMCKLLASRLLEDQPYHLLQKTDDVHIVQQTLL